MKKVNKDWFVEGFSILEEESFSKLTISNLCARLKITKGSFYYWFKNMEAYTEELMKYWLEENTLSFINEVEKVQGTFRKRYLLYNLAAHASHRVEQEIRAWSFIDPIVRKYVEQVDRIRLKFLIYLKRAEGLNPVEARQASMLEYAVLVGIQLLFPDLSKREVKQLQKRYNSHN